MPGLQSQTAWVAVPAPPLSGCVALGKVLYSLFLSFPICKMGMIARPHQELHGFLDQVWHVGSSVNIGQDGQQSWLHRYASSQVSQSPAPRKTEFNALRSPS